MNNIANVSVIICTYTEARWDELAAAVHSVQIQTTRPQELLIVVDHNAKLRDRVQQAFPDAVVIENQEPRGASGARNTAIAIAQAPIIAFLDDDVIVGPDWLEQLVAAYSDPCVVAVGGTVEAKWLAGRPQWFPKEFDWVAGCTYLGMPTTTAPVRNLILANMSCRSEVFEKAGTFENSLGPKGKRLKICCEDTEFCIRIQNHWPNRIILYHPAARVQHQIPKSRGTWSYFLTRCYGEGIAKALVTNLVGAKKGLASERKYTLETLPRGVLQGIADTLSLRDLFGLARAGAIMLGFAATTAGYIIGFTRHKLDNFRTNMAAALHGSTVSMGDDRG